MDTVPSDDPMRAAQLNNEALIRLEVHNLDVTLLGQEPHFERLAVQAEDLAADLLLAGSLPLNPLLADLELEPPIGQLGFVAALMLAGAQVEIPPEGPEGTKQKMQDRINFFMLTSLDLE
jgi:hypothetical protein